MKRPAPPPDVNSVWQRLSTDDPAKMRLILPTSPGDGPTAPYLPWDRVRFKTPPEGLTLEEWWAKIKLARQGMLRRLPLTDIEGRPFTFALPDVVLKALEDITRDASGKIAASTPSVNPASRDEYLISSLIEEAINSSQLEGASTTRRVAKEMLRAGRSPRTRDERMIANNYAAMRMIGDLRGEKLTPDLVREIHRVVTESTLDNPDSAGRFQLPHEERIGVFADTGLALHTPPPAEQLPERMERLCAFANGELDDTFVPPVLRAITLHFMLGYDHPFADGNGRTARALFYWSMLNQGYWLTEFVAISPIIKQAPARYARAYLYTEDDAGDLTYFHIHQLDVLRRSITRLHEYLARKSQETRDLQHRLTDPAMAFNHRQSALLGHVLKHPDADVTAQSHKTSHNVVYETARRDLTDLEERGLLVKHRIGKAFVWHAAPDLERRLRGSA
ncbi:MULTISPECIES: Fic family protein [unclassified Streptomyces]|uniref:Fic family protein n=1 Tax=unclassified Streptomyces TaxID=2593676 RepID=UPI00278C46E1|nr:MULTISPECIES: Fic family protein [unclassified Streptomyces]